MATPEPHWWSCLPALPVNKTDRAYRRLMRVFADQTWSFNLGSYNPKSEQHLTVNFFENFTLDPAFAWITALADRLGMRSGPIRAASWSYEFEAPKTTLIADLVIGWQDDAGPALIVIETKRAGALPPGAVDGKNDPLVGRYLDLEPFSDIPRRRQMLVVSEAAVGIVPSRVRASPQLITWEELGALQIAVLGAATGERSDFKKMLILHHRHLGIKAFEGRSASAVHVAPVPADDRAIDAWMAGLGRYIRAKQGTEGEPPAAFADDPPRIGLTRNAAQRQERLWDPAWP